MIIHNEPCLVELYGKEFFLAHGDEFSKEKSYKMLRALFRSRLARTAFSMLHPRWGLWMGHKWSQYSMKKHKQKGDTPYLGEEKEHCIIFAREYLEKHSSVDCFIFGHRHIDVDIPLGESSRCIFLGDWIYTFAYVVWDGKTISHERYVEGDVAQVMSQG